jgi:hypothetical protein
LRASALPLRLTVLGYAGAYVPALALAAVSRKKNSIPVFLAAAWVSVLGILSRVDPPGHSPWIHLWVALGACGLCYWGMRDNRKLFINYGTAIFALNVITFCFDDLWDLDLGRSMGLILMGLIFLAGGWVLNRLRNDLIARADAAGGQQ